MKKIMFNDEYGLTQAVLEGRKTQTRRLLQEKMRRDIELVIKIQNKALNMAFESTFGKKFDPEKVYKPNLRRYIHNSGIEHTIHWAYCNRVFMVEKDYVDMLTFRVYTEFTVPKKMFVRKENGKFKFVEE